MDISLQPGKYVVAVSGGVDSIALLHMLHEKPDLELMVAHFDHGIRPDSALDREFVEQMAKARGLDFVYAEGKLGPNASEATARTARYKFLAQAKKTHAAKAIITAHHQDDVLETALINLIRGTNRRGLSSLKSTDTIQRPLLNITKKEIRDYAKRHGLIWREDSTNSDTSYLRNYIRHNIVKNMSPAKRQELLGLVTGMSELNDKTDQEIANFLQFAGGEQSLNRKEFIYLPHNVAKEAMAYWLRAHNIRQFDRKTLELLVSKIKTLAVGKQVDIDSGHFLKVGKTDIILCTR